MWTTLCFILLGHLFQHSCHACASRRVCVCGTLRIRILQIERAFIVTHREQMSWGRQRVCQKFVIFILCLLLALLCVRMYVGTFIVSQQNIPFLVASTKSTSASSSYPASCHARLDTKKNIIMQCRVRRPFFRCAVSSVVLCLSIVLDVKSSEIFPFEDAEKKQRRETD